MWDDPEGRMLSMKECNWWHLYKYTYANVKNTLLLPVKNIKIL